MSDLIDRQDALEAICTWDKFGVDALSRVVWWHEGLEPYVHLRDVVWAIENMPSAQPEITLESAIDYLHDIGWMQEHDRIMTESAQEDGRGDRMNDLISRQDAIDALKEHRALYCDNTPDTFSKLSYWVEKSRVDGLDTAIATLINLPSVEPEIIRCKDCEYGEQDKVGRWFCISLGCQIGNEDGSGYCADAERRTNE